MYYRLGHSDTVIETLWLTSPFQLLDKGQNDPLVTRLILNHAIQPNRMMTGVASPAAKAEGGAIRVRINLAAK
jgi:hypothetical protein